MKRAPIAVTMGDACGVGPEILLRAFTAGATPEDVVAVGDLEVLAHCARTLGLDVSLRPIRHPAECWPGALNVVSLNLLRLEDLRVGEVCAPAGRAALGYVEHATHLALDGAVRAIVTLPVNKEAVRLTHPDFTGHTGFIARRCGSPRHAMMLASPALLATHVSTHVALAEAVRRVTRDRVYEVIRLTDEAAARLGRCRRIAVLGLNP
ncbi:MAG: 4-hydroxythreonine-4-phosphate dehydrogenase PdxA, partial [Armatimonadota bacterium]|nr:4-hydroxythreonine-4-phosphate dehydrogenase PdxA [Armatimonadota bacterium]